LRVVDGPFCGYFGLVDDLDEPDAIGLLMNVFGRESRVKVPIEHLAAM
jgi:transcription antitermination factor NusG